MRMSSYLSGRFVVRLLALFLCLAGTCWAQFTANIQGTVTDPSAAGVGQAKVTLENLSNHVTAETTTDGDLRKYKLDAMPFQANDSNNLDLHTQNFVEAIRHNDPSILKCGIESGSVAAINASMLMNSA